MCIIGIFFLELLSIFFLELLRGADERMCGSVSRKTPGTHSINASCGNRCNECCDFIYFTGDGTEAQRGKRPAKVIQLHSHCPRSGAPRADPKGRICLMMAVVLGGLGRGRESWPGKTRKPSQLQLQVRFWSRWAHSDPVGEPR